MILTITLTVGQSVCFDNAVLLLFYPKATTKKYLVSGNPTLVLKSESVGRRDLAGARRSGVTTPTIIGRVKMPTAVMARSLAAG